jgi:hypothetical protein
MVRIHVEVVSDARAGGGAIAAGYVEDLTANDLFVVLSTIVGELERRQQWIGPRPVMRLEEPGREMPHSSASYPELAVAHRRRLGPDPEPFESL